MPNSKELRLGFAGTPEFAARHLDALIHSRHNVAAVLTQPDRRSGRGKKTRPSDVKALALEHKLEVLQPATLRAADAQDAVAALNLDLLVVVAYGLLLPQKVLDLPKYGCMNVHGSLLPRWRGAAPIQRAVEAGDEQSGVTIMLMDAGLDTGPMLATSTCPITPVTTSGDLYSRMAELGPQLLLEVLSDLPAKMAAATVQDDSLATHAAKISKEEAQIDWEDSGLNLARRIRAFNPAPGCYSFLNDQRIKIWEASPGPANKNAASCTPGTILSIESEALQVACGEGSLYLHKIQLPGAKAMPVKELLRGRGEQFAQGQVFDATPQSGPEAS